MESHQDLDLELNQLIEEYGLVATLEAMKGLVKARATVIASAASNLTDSQAEAFQDVANTLGVLIKALPEEIDIEIALAQVTHTAPDFDPDTTKLAGGME